MTKENMVMVLEEKESQTMEGVLESDWTEPQNLSALTK
jgi:hypothetical protein